MLGPRNWLSRNCLVACGAAWLCLSGCSGKEFVSGDGTGGSGADSGTGGSNAAGNTSGGSSSGGTAGTDAAGDTSGAGTPDPGGSGGSGGSVSTGCDCPAGHYCRDGSTDCFDCAELSRLRFAPPERLATPSAGAGSRFPRVGLTGTDLFYHFDGVGLRYTTDASTSAGSSVKGTIPQDTAPLLLKGDVSGVPGGTLMSFNFVFDRPAEVGRRQLMIGAWQNALGMPEAMPAPFNTGKNDFSMAIALHATPDNVPRAFWMTGRDMASLTLGPTLVTSLLSANSAGAVVTLNVGKAGCTPIDFTPAKVDPDLTPWVTEDGKTLLISTTRQDANCASAGQGKDIYTALLQPATGQPTAAALPMSDVNSQADDVDPSFSADLCDLYFSSNRDGKFALYRAHRR
jgi:hypothetical protein